MNTPAQVSHIAPATPADIDGLAQVNYTAWQETYRGIIHDNFLNNVSLQQYLNRWQQILEHRGKGGSFILAAHNTQGQVIGYCSGGPVREPFNAIEGEIYALYLLKQYQGQGIGAALFKAGLQALQQADKNSVCLFVLQQNPTINFYRHYQPHTEKTLTVDIGGHPYPEVGLGWNNLSNFGL